MVCGSGAVECRACSLLKGGAGTNDRDPRQERGVSVVRECVAQFTSLLGCVVSLRYV